MGGSAVLGIGLALIGTLCSAIGYTLQKLAHRRADADQAKHRQEAATAPTTAPDDTITAKPPPKSYWKYWQFPAGLGMLVLGSVFSVITMGMAGQAELAPMAATTMIWNMLLAWRILREPFGRFDAAALLMMSLGTTIALIFAEKNSRNYDLNDILTLLDRPFVWAYAAVTLTAVLAGAAVVHVLGKRPAATLSMFQARVDSAARSLIAGMLGGYTGFLVKSIVEVAFGAIRRGDGSDMLRVEPYVFIVALVACLFNQVRYMNSGLARYESSRIIPVYQSTLVFSGAASGYIFWNEVAVQTMKSLTLFGVGCGLTMLGMVVLMWKPHPNVSSSSTSTAVAEVDVSNGKPVELQMTPLEAKEGVPLEVLTTEDVIGSDALSPASDRPHYARHRPRSGLSMPNMTVETSVRPKSSTSMADATVWMQHQAASIKKNITMWSNGSYSPLRDDAHFAKSEDVSIEDGSIATCSVEAEIPQVLESTIPPLPVVVS